MTTIKGKTNKIEVNENLTLYYESGSLICVEKPLDKIEVYIYNDGVKEWYKNGEFHRDNGPAIIWSDGSEEWYQNGDLHRDGDLPAATYNFGYDDDIKNKWSKHGVLHRDSGPAVIRFDGSEEWYQNGAIK